jgi:hypothetical protein
MHAQALADCTSTPRPTVWEMKPHTIALKPASWQQPEAKLDSVRQEIEREKELRATLELTLAQLLREQRTLLFSIPSPTEPDHTPPSSLLPSQHAPTTCTTAISSNPRRRRDRDHAKLKKKRAHIFNKLLNLDYVLKRRAIAERERTTRTQRARMPAECRVPVLCSAMEEPGSTSPIGQTSFGSAPPPRSPSPRSLDAGCTPPSSPPALSAAVQSSRHAQLSPSALSSDSSALYAKVRLDIGCPAFLSAGRMGTTESTGDLGGILFPEQDEGFDLSCFLNSPLLGMLV